MLRDLPLQRKTSPINMFVNEIVCWLLVALRVMGLKEGWRGANTIRQNPSVVPAVVAPDSGPRVTWMLAPTSAQPQIGMGSSCWSVMKDPKVLLRVREAPAKANTFKISESRILK